MEQNLEQVIRNYTSISENDLKFAVSLFHPITLKKGQLLLDVGQRCQHVAFVKSGMLRICYPNDKGEDTTCYFALPEEFVTSYSSFTTGKPSTEKIEAILPTESYLISKKDLDMLYQKIPTTQALGRKSAENVAIFMEKRLGLFQNHSADERYAYLMEHSPVLIQTVPLQYLASFLGITPQHLSRLRKKMAT